MPPSTTTFGQRLRQLREARGLTQTQLASAAGLTANAVARLERGERSPAWETAQALAAALGVRLDALARTR